MDSTMLKDPKTFLINIDAATHNIWLKIGMNNLLNAKGSSTEMWYEAKVRIKTMGRLSF